MSGLTTSTWNTGRSFGPASGPGAPTVEVLKERIEKLEEEHGGSGVEQIKREMVARVMDADGEVTRIELVSGRWASRTDEAGRFEIDEVPPGDYRLEVRLPGFAAVEETLVSADGLFQVLNVLTPVDPDLLTPVQPDLARAAVDAARKWQFELTRLHGVPVDTRMTVTVNFTDES